MAAFADALMVKYADDAEVASLLTPAGDGSHARVRRLLESVYSFPLLAIRSVDDVTVLGKEFQVPLVHPVDLRGTLDAPADPSRLLHVALTSAELGTAAWVGMEVDLTVSVGVEITSGSIEQVLSEDLTDVASLAEFESRFDFIDVPAFMAEVGVDTLDELKSTFPRKFRMLYAQPPAFDPDDPRFRRDFRLAVCVLFEPQLDLVHALQAVRLARRAAAAARPHRGEQNGAEVRAPAAWMVVFPRAALTPGAPSESDVRELLASADVEAAFEDAP